MTNKNIPRVERIEKVWTPDAKLWTPYQGSEIAFASPSFGPNTYQAVGEEIIAHGLKVPTGDYTASLVHTAFCDENVKNEEEFEKVRDIVRNRWLWVYDINLFTDKGIYILQDLKALGRSRPLVLQTLEKMLEGGKEIKGTGVRESCNGILRFAPKGSYRFGEHTSDSFAHDGFVIARAGVEGAERLGEVSTHFRNKLYSSGVEVSEGQPPQQYVSALDEDGDWLRFLGNYFLDGTSGHAFGVFGTNGGRE